LKAIIVQRWEEGGRGSLDELKSLAESAGYEVVGALEQVRREDPSYHIGRGKAEELSKLVRDLMVDKVIFGNLLKPVQEYRLATLTQVEIIDRMRLILEIFARRAFLKEAKLQIKLARLRYEAARAKEKVRLAKIGEQPGFHGLGKYDVDVYYRMIKRQITHVDALLKKIRKARDYKRSKRRKQFLSAVALAGYTNAGKSTLFNLLTRESVPVGQGLFTTLSPVSRITNFDGKKALLIDSVGFIDDLPLLLLEAFKATLEETIFADLILLVVDISDPISEVFRKLRCCLNTLSEIGITNIPMVTALNKVDLINESDLNNKLKCLADLAPNAIPISALYGTNVSELRKGVASLLREYVKAEIVMPIVGGAAPIISLLRSHSGVIKEVYTKEGVRLEVEAFPSFLNKIKAMVDEVGGEVII
jgi:GTP-binding protein HflX